MMGRKKVVKQVIAKALVSILISNSTLPVLGEDLTNNAQIVSDYNTSIGTGSPYIFGGVGTPLKDEGEAWNTIATDMGMKIAKVPVNLGRLFPHDENIDTNVLEDYTHVAGSIFTNMRGSGMEIMLQFHDIPTWLDSDGDKMYDNENTYKALVTTFLKAAEGYNDIIKFIEITPSPELNAENFSKVYYDTAKVVKDINSTVLIGGPGDILENKNDILDVNMRQVLTDSTLSVNEGLLEFVSVRGYEVEPTDGNSNKEIFGEFKQGRKQIRTLTNNKDIPLFMTGWTTSSEGELTANNKVVGVEGIKYHTSALFKAIRDGWDLVLFDKMVSESDNPGSYIYRYPNNNFLMELPTTTSSALELEYEVSTTPPALAIDSQGTLKNGEVQLNPFYKVYNLLGKQLGLNKGEFKVVSTNMGSNWAVQDSIAMVNSDNEAIMLFLNFENPKSNIRMEMKNLPYEDGTVTLKGYVASGEHTPDSIYYTQEVEIQNGILNTVIPTIPANCVMGIRIEGGSDKRLGAQSIYEFESQDNHFGGNMEITWSTNASFNRVVKGFGGENNFTTLKKIHADGTGTYTAKVYAETQNATVRVATNEGVPISIDASNVSLNNPVEFDVKLEAGENNTLKFYTERGELRPDRLVLIPKDVTLDIGFQNLNSLASEGTGAERVYVLPLAKTDFKIDARIFPESASQGKILEFKSSDTNVVTINSEGLIMPKNVGEAIITAKIQGLDIQKSFNISVRNKLASISVNPSKLTLLKGKSAYLEAVLTPIDAEDSEIRWESSNPQVAEVKSYTNNTAEIISMGQIGTTIINAMSIDGKIKGSCTVTVIEPVIGGNIMIDYDATIAKGSPNIFGITHYPSINKEDSDIGDHSQVWDMLRDQAGVRFMRADARLQEILPIWTKTPNTNWERPAAGEFDSALQPNYVKSDLYYVEGPDGIQRQFNLEDYKADMEYFEANGKYLNGLSNPANWNTDRLMSWVDKAKETGFEVMVMTFQIPEWLSAGEIGPGDPHTKKVCNGAPRDWAIYRDIVKKVYTMLRDKIDYYEFLNEPHWYVPTRGDQRDPSGIKYTGPGMENKIATDQFYQAIDAIYEVERELTGDPNAKPKVKLGGGADDSWGGSYGVLGNIFSEKYKDWIDRVEFVSIHKYGDRPANQDNSNNGANTRNLKHWLRQRTGKNIPLYLNEYNISTGQPTEETYGSKSLGWHTKLMIDLMVDGYEGGGYYTSYPADVPMDDYEASAGWIERGKGMYTWNSGNPYLATFAKGWGLLSNDLGLGKGKFDVKATTLNDKKISQAIGAVNSEGNPVAILNNYSTNQYSDTKVMLYNVPFAKGSEVEAEVYIKDKDSAYTMKPVVQRYQVDQDGNVQVNIDAMGAYSVCGILLKGDQNINQDQKNYEFESYTNKIRGNAKIEIESSASNGRWVVNADGIENSISVPLEKEKSGKSKIEVFYSSIEDAILYYQINNGSVKNIELPATKGIGKVAYELEFETGINEMTFYSQEGKQVKLDKMTKTNIDKETLQELVNLKFEESYYTQASWNNYSTAKKYAVEVLENQDATSYMIQKAYEELTTAIEGLELMVDLEELINMSFDAARYTTLSWYRYVEAREKARVVLASTTSEEDIIAAYNHLQMAINNLKEILIEDSNLIKGVIPTTNAQNILFSEASTDGKIICSDVEESVATQIEVGEEIGGSDNGYGQWTSKYLQYDLGSLVDIKSIDVYRPYYNGGGPIRWKDTQVQFSTTESFEPGTIVYETVVEDLVLPSGQDIATSSNFDEPIRAQYVRINGRGHQGSWGGYSNKMRIVEVIIKGSIVEEDDVLQIILQEVYPIVDNEEIYEVESYRSFKKAYERVQELSQQANASQEEINIALSELALTKEQLKEKVKIDKSNLENLIRNIKSSGVLEAENKYTQESFDNLKKEFKKSEEILADVNVSQQQVNEATESLKESYQGLELRQESGNNDSSDDDTTNDGEDSTTDDTTNDSGDSALDNSTVGEGLGGSINSFVDVDSHWAYESIKFVLEKGIFVGVTDTKFEPDSFLTRGMFITVLGRLDSLVNEDSKIGLHKESKIFKDLDEGKYYSPYINWGKEMGIVNGISADEFLPNTEITREQLAVIVNRYVSLMDLKLDVDEEKIIFEDSNQISPWALESVKKMHKSGIMVGTGGNTFSPQDKVTRAQAAKILHMLAKITQNNLVGY